MALQSSIRNSKIATSPSRAESILARHNLITPETLVNVLVLIRSFFVKCIFILWTSHQFEALSPYFSLRTQSTEKRNVAINRFKNGLSLPSCCTTLPHVTELLRKWSNGRKVVLMLEPETILPWKSIYGCYSQGVSSFRSLRRRVVSRVQRHQICYLSPHFHPFFGLSPQERWRVSQVCFENPTDLNVPQPPRHSRTQSASKTKCCNLLDLRLCFLCQAAAQPFLSPLVTSQICFRSNLTDVDII
jgi:hypothetical protein